MLVETRQHDVFISGFILYCTLICNTRLCLNKENVCLVTGKNKHHHIVCTVYLVQMNKAYILGIYCRKETWGVSCVRYLKSSIVFGVSVTHLKQTQVSQSLQHIHISPADRSQWSVTSAVIQCWVIYNHENLSCPQGEHVQKEFSKSLR